MNILCLPTKQIYSYILTGKFKAPSSEWIHMNLQLIDYELIVMTEGILYLNYGGENFIVKNGEYLLLPPSSSCRKGFRPSYCAFYWLHFTTQPGGFPPILTSNTILPPPDQYFTLPQTGTIPKPERVVILMKQLQDIVKSKYPPISLDTMSTSIVMELFGQLTLVPPVENYSATQKQIYYDIMDYIKTNISRNIKISEITATFGYNEKYISHRFAEVCGIPLKQYILKTKVDRANYMLTDTNKSVKEIAKDLGFPDSHNFSRTYKKITGLSPSEYRNTFSKRLLYHI